MKQDFENNLNDSFDENENVYATQTKMDITITDQDLTNKTELFVSCHDIKTEDYKQIINDLENEITLLNNQ